MRKPTKPTKPAAPPSQRMSPDEVRNTLAKARDLAKSRCKRCYGTGTMGTKIVSVRERTILICPCVEKMASKIAETRRVKAIAETQAQHSGTAPK